ncbi:CoA ester lyase [Actinoplanes bogorensis]|uniref:CoA ester lyase n=1 Tax=Paractinoplanes bogorensis TaxID=1610840 RepID=A0ABS5YUQ0_9ACTN|nr:CoA ester lyase [Actinoplanes bogorensis]MBU2667177.1 CoA ester lyase [Actinoplanes bogorensis]
MSADRARRTCLTVPGDNTRMLDKSAGRGADEVIYDLEDSVVPAQKSAARGTVIDFLKAAPTFDGVRSVRINGVDTAWAHRDVVEIVAAAGLHFDTIVLPKVEHPGAIHWLDLLLSQLEAENDLPRGRIGIEAQIEGPGGMLRLEAIAQASPRLQALIFGPGDFMAAMRLPDFDLSVTPDALDALDLCRWQIAMTCRLHGLAAIDGPYPQISDIEGCRRSADRARRLGYDGKWVLHPAQVTAVNDVFRPSPEALTRARAIIAALDNQDASAAGGALMLGDQMIDEATRRWALSVVAGDRPLRES